VDAARLAYLNGRGDFSTVIEDFSLWLDARVQLAAREADRFVTWAGLQSLTRGSAAGGSEMEH
jgi:outer membrane protein TolC